MHVEPHLSAEGLDSLIRCQSRVRLRRRLRAVALALGGDTAAEIAEAFERGSAAGYDASRVGTRAGGRRPGSPTRPASASRGR